MNRRAFLGGLVGLAVVQPDKTTMPPKWGYVSAGIGAFVVDGYLIRPGDIIVYVNGRTRPDLCIVRAHDTEGWYEYTVERLLPSRYGPATGLPHRQTVHERADIRFEWREAVHIETGARIYRAPHRPPVRAGVTTLTSCHPPLPR